MSDRHGRNASDEEHTDEVTDRLESVAERLERIAALLEKHVDSVEEEDALDA